MTARVYDPGVTGTDMDYDIAVSFAGAQRNLVEPIVRACQALGVTTFYDKDSTVEFWGRDFITGMREIYGGARTRYFVPFLSEEYLSSAYPMDEYHAALPRSIEVRDYILPIVVGSVNVPAELLSPATGFLRLEDYTTDRLARVIADRVGVARDRRQEPREVTGVVDAAFGVRLPRIPPTSFSPHETLETALVRVGALFRREADTLTPFGIRSVVRLTGTDLDIRVDRQGRPVCGLRLFFADSFRDDRLLMSFAWPRISGDAFNGWITAEWDAEASRSGLKFTDLSLMSGDPVLITADELFHRLWHKIINHVENVR
jgi:hypothetical protein